MRFEWEVGGSGREWDEITDALRCTALHCGLFVVVVGRCRCRIAMNFMIS